MLFYSGWQEHILEDLLSCLALCFTTDSLLKVDVETISATRRQKRADLESSPSLFKLSALFSVLTKERYSTC